VGGILGHGLGFFRGAAGLREGKEREKKGKEKEREEEKGKERK